MAGARPGSSPARLQKTQLRWHTMTCTMLATLGNDVGHAWHGICRLKIRWGLVVRKEVAMIPFRRFAFFTVARDASFVALAALMLMVAFSFEPPLAFEVGATVALVFSIGLLIRSYLLTEETFLRSEAWYALRPDERPIGDHEQHLARAQLEELLLRFAKAASGVAGLLYISALLLSASSAGYGGI
jgi:hypothetical protein